MSEMTRQERGAFLPSATISAERDAQIRSAAPSLSAGAPPSAATSAATSASISTAPRGARPARSGSASFCALHKFVFLLLILIAPSPWPNATAPRHDSLARQFTSLFGADDGGESRLDYGSRRDAPSGGAGVAAWSPQRRKYDANAPSAHRKARYHHYHNRYYKPRRYHITLSIRNHNVTEARFFRLVGVDNTVDFHVGPGKIFTNTYTVSRKGYWTLFVEFPGDRYAKSPRKIISRDSFAHWIMEVYFYPESVGFSEWHKMHKIQYDF